MFDFQKLSVYQKAKNFNVEVASLIENNQLDLNTERELQKASFGILIKISETTSYPDNKDKIQTLLLARAKVFGCAALIDFLKETGKIDEYIYLDFFERLDEISEILNSLIKKLKIDKA